MGERVAALVQPRTPRHLHILVHWDDSACRPRAFGVDGCAVVVSHRCAVLGSNRVGSAEPPCTTYTKDPKRGLWYMAERVGFEPTEPRGSTVFKTAAFDHSATSPVGR